MSLLSVFNVKSPTFNDHPLQSLISFSISNSGHVIPTLRRSSLITKSFALIHSLCSFNNGWSSVHVILCPSSIVSSMQGRVPLFKNPTCLDFTKPFLFSSKPKTSILLFSIFLIFILNPFDKVKSISALRQSLSISPNLSPPSRALPSGGWRVRTCLGPRAREWILSWTKCFNLM